MVVATAHSHRICDILASPHKHPQSLVSGQFSSYNHATVSKLWNWIRFSEALAAATEVAATLKSVNHLFLLLSTLFPEHGMCQSFCFCQIFTLDPTAHVGAAAILDHVHLSMAITADDPMATSHTTQSSITLLRGYCNHHSKYHCQGASWFPWSSHGHLGVLASTSVAAIPSSDDCSQDP